MCKHFSHSTKIIRIFFEDEEIEVYAGLTVATALVSHMGYTRLTEKNKTQRAPFCHMGICFECLMHIDGKDNQQACMTQVREGMRVYRQLSRRTFSQSTDELFFVGGMGEK